MRKFELELHPEKTRLIRFGRFAGQNCHKEGRRKPETLAFLGFTHICGRSSKGRFLLVRHTIAKRQTAKLQEIKRELKSRRHDPIPEQGRWLRQVVSGHYQYYGVPTNSTAIGRFRDEVTRHWLRSLRRRSQRHCLTWERMRRLVRSWLPPRAYLPPLALGSFPRHYLR